MAFKLKSDESVPKGIRRIARKQLDAALENLNGKHSGGRDEAVHEARKCFKRIRAILRLVRPVVGEEIYQAENICLRDAGRPLTEVRDAKILIETFDQIKRDSHLTGASFDNIRQELQANLRRVRKQMLDEHDAFCVVAETVRQARERVKHWSSVPNKWSSVADGLKDTYRGAAAAFEQVLDNSTVETLHEWRKQAKYLRYQFQVLRPLWEARLTELAEETGEMGSLLGDDHDLAVLRQMMTDEPERFGDKRSREKLVALIDQRRPKLQQEANVVGRRFFLDRPKDSVRRFNGYWKTWRSQSDLEPTTA